MSTEQSSPSQDSTSSTFPSRFEIITKYIEREVLNQRTLVHPHVIRFHEVFLTDDELCMVLELAPGGNLRTLVNKYGALHENTARSYFQQMILSIDYCHKRKTCIRDLKLENLVLNENGTVIKLCDFGLSKYIGNCSMPHSCVGTPHYVAPEILLSANRRSYDGEKSDVWSAGVCLFVMIYGYFPFDDPYPEETTRQRLVLEKIKKGNVSLPVTQVLTKASGVRARPLSEHCLDLLNGLLQNDPYKRLSVEEILRHPWFLTYLPEGAIAMNAGVTEEDERLLGGLNGMQKRSELKQLVGIAMNHDVEIKWLHSCTMMFCCNVHRAEGTYKLNSTFRRSHEFAKRPFLKNTLYLKNHGKTRSCFGKVVNSALSIDPPTPPKKTVTATVVIYYKTWWTTAFLHGSINGAPWTDVRLSPSPHGRWRTVSIEVEPNQSTPVLEFVLTDGDGLWDKTKDGTNFTIQKPGNYRVQNGVVREIKMRAAMLVSDLDGTMIGDDHATKAFSDFWILHSSFTNSTLVYNTGRSLDSFVQLLDEKKECLITPDVLISAVGTKIHKHDEGLWNEDPGWVVKMEKDWDLLVVTEAAESAVTVVGSESMHFRPKNEQNEYKVTCGVRNECIKKALEHIQSKLYESGVKANLIYSGIGDWRFLDIVPQSAGKLEALNYVRVQYGYALRSTVACGDSGNDILMLSGKNLAIVVSNAQPDLKDWLNNEVSKDQNKNRLFMATQKEAYGILEGLENFQFC
eukprot:g291.t1